VIAEASPKGRLTGGNRRVARFRTANAGQPNQAIGRHSSVKNATIVDVEKRRFDTLRLPSHGYFVGSGALPDEVRVSTGGDSGVSQGKVPSSRN
jgi:hypothetical protein